DYDTARQNATYRHQPKPYAFAFGHGCTYSSVVYEAVGLINPAATAPKPTYRHAAFDPADEVALVRAVVAVRNTGDRDAEELVQLYALPPAGLPIAAPLRILVAYQRVRLAPGERRSVELEFSLERLAVWDDAQRLPGAPNDWLHAGALRVQPGEYRIAAGPSADRLPATAILRVAG
ncbi:fibronectin type III-like domain-contianing protein, partial [Humibacter sp.]|uniref:fibronectin type III-like domain-contianing protein n=1 Tax=Humibacter sp. TaxID=1940291 RepID=UPI003F7D63D7